MNQLSGAIPLEKTKWCAKAEPNTGSLGKHKVLLGVALATQYFSDLQGHEHKKQLISWHRYSQKQHRLSDLFPGSVKSNLAFSPA